jgi:chloramphenicol 3-O-phosphotransferase
MDLNEGMNQHGALKFVFLAGGAGSGKNHVANELFGIGKGLSFSASGMKLVSFDAIFEKLLERHGYPTNLQQLKPKDREKVMDELDPKSLYSMGRKIMKKQMSLYMKSGIGIIFDGTGRNIGSYLNKKEMAEFVGYDTYLLFVDVPLKVALKRNSQRTRRLPVKDVTRIHHDVKQNRAEYERIFGNNMIVVNNRPGQSIPAAIQHQIDTIVGSPVKNPTGQYRMAHNGQLPARLKPQHKAPPTADPQVFQAQKDGSHALETPKGKVDSDTTLDLFPGEIDALSKKNTVTEPQAKKEPTSWWQNFKTKQAALTKKLFGSKKDTQLQSLMPGQERIRNPETGNDILVTTALGYPPGHPMRQAAEKYLKDK